MKKLSFLNLLILASAISGVNLAFTTQELKVSASNEEVYEEGVLPIDEIDMEEYLKRYETKPVRTVLGSELASSSSTVSTYGSSCDLSNSIYFPSIGNQKGGSCTSWATTYYQFTYEANKLNDINTKEDNNMAYSPVWTFSFLNGGVGEGAYIYQAYDFLEKHGALRIADCGYNDNLYEWSTKTDKMIEALNTRISKDGAIKVSSFRASENLDEIKSMLYGTDGTDGKVLAFSTCNRWVTSDEEHIAKNLDTDETLKVAYRCYEGGGHAMVIVGYNDNIWVDINGNGIVEETEKGAFKIANSWGDNAVDHNAGFRWVSYDALNSNTLVDGDWEEKLIADKKAEIDATGDKLESRVPAFYYSDKGFNTVYWIEVENKTPMYIGQLTVDTEYRNSLEIFARNNLADTEENEFKLYHDQVKIDDEWKDAKSLVLKYKGTLVFDYDDLCDPISDYIDGYDWGIRATGNHNSVSFKITDNLSNTVVDFGELSKDTSTDSYQADKPISLSMGDLNYDGTVDIADSKILFNATYKDGKLSNLQKYLAKDMDIQIRAAVTPSGYDNIGEVLDNINVGNIFWDEVSSDVDSQTLKDGKYDVLFINCANQVNIDESVIREFVENGGTVYASDWALDALTGAFTGLNFSFVELDEQTVTANIVNDGLQISTGFKEVPINFDLPDWRLITSQLPKGADVYIEGEVNGKTYPLVFSFQPYEDSEGKVYYTSFHHDANNTPEMQEVLNDLILTINHTKNINEFDSYADENNHELTAAVTGILDAGATSNKYTIETSDNCNSFIIMTEETGNFSIELTAPDGSTYTNFENGEFVDDLSSISPLNIENTMRICRLGKRGIQVINPISSNDNNQWSFTVTSHVKYRSSFVVGIAEESASSSEFSDYTIDYKIVEDWGTGQNIEITISNTGDTPIRNWALQCDDFFGTITKVWNARLQGENIIRCETYNSDIPAGSSVTIGYTLINATGGIPEFHLCSFRSAKQDGYSVDFNVLSDWGEGFIGEIIITNTTDAPIMAWELNFDAINFTISATSQFDILANLNQNYTITGTYNGNIPIPANSSITLQFNGEKTGTPSISNISMTEMKIEE